MDALTTVQTLCEASTTPHRAAATCAKAMLGVINNQDEIRADETLRASAQDACIALVHSCRGASRWGALRALSVLGLCSAGQTSNLSVALVRNDEALDPRALRVLVAVLPAESGAEHAFLDFCLSTSKAHLTEAVRQLLELRNDQDAGGAANLAMRLFKSGFLDLLASDQTDDAQENVARAETVSLLLSALGFWWKPSKTSFATDQVPRSFDADFLVDTVLALPVKASSAALCCGVLALHIGFGAQDRSHKDFAFMEDQTSFSQIVRKIFERLRKISVAESESSEASQESLELWLWPLLCLLRTLASLDAPAAAAIAVGLPFSSRLPLHVQHWACAALSLTTRPRGQVQEWALKISRNETWFSGTERDARTLASAALSARHFCIATGLEIAFPHTVLAPETWLAAFAQNEELQAHTSVEMLGLLAILNFKGGLRAKLCTCREPRTVLLLLDVSRSLNRTILLDVYVEAIRKLHCGLNLAPTTGDAGYDAIGLITFGSKERIEIPVARYTETDWLDELDRFREGNPAVSNWSECCTPLASAFDLARKDLEAGELEGRISLHDSNVLVQVLTDGFPVQNRLTIEPQEYRRWTQEKYCPSRYRMRLVPRMAGILEATPFNATVSTMLLQNRKGLDKMDAMDYFSGLNLPEYEISRKRQPYIEERQGKGYRCTHTPKFFPVVTAPAEDHVDALDESMTAVDVANAILALMCGSDMVAIGDPCPGTLAPTSNPTILTPQPTPSPTHAVSACLGDKDLIFLVDSSNSISDLEVDDDGVERQVRFQDFVLQIAEDLQRIQTEGAAKQRTGLITFSRTIQERIPLAAYNFSEWHDEIENVRDMASDLVGCCTPTAEAFRAARKMLEARTEYSDNPAIVFVITDGIPMINKEPYENVPGDLGGEVQYRRGDATGSTAEGRTMTLGEYRSSVVFKEAQDLNAIGNVTTMLVGVRNNQGAATQVEYFLGDENQITSCKGDYDVSPLMCSSCAGKTDPCLGEDSSGECWVTGSVDHSCSAFYTQGLVQEAQEAVTDDLDSLITSLSEFICGADFVSE
ncbi:Cartilage matrix protein [Hondaea fermentalgiana]|uniref:Cartilage matrix protein n=1 Tax=Hondaea fermentalgiana TaxID=2315210 RepID=A0A2R5GIG5_9STRA|nr:Cartilage matrix protein [Hondaea fermentalgiana]|eukprot:GBG28071.1 Cartilage matrix protein [Hondaea fermentalgiana]